MDDDKDIWDISKWEDAFLLDSTKPKDQEKIADKFYVTAGWKKYVSGRKGEMEDTVCVKNFNLLYLCKTYKKSILQ